MRKRDTIATTKNILLTIPLLGLLGMSNTTFSQETLKEIPENIVPTQEISINENNSNNNRFKPGAKIGKIVHPNTNGFEFCFYLCNPNLQIGYIIENNKKSKVDSPGKGIDLFKMGFEFNYFFTNNKVLRPYLGTEVKYEDESLFVGRADRYHKKNGVGLEIKIGTEINPIKNKKIGLFFDIGYNSSIGKESKGYPKNPEVERDKLYSVFGMKF